MLGNTKGYFYAEGLGKIVGQSFAQGLLMGRVVKTGLVVINQKLQLATGATLIQTVAGYLT